MQPFLLFGLFSLTTTHAPAQQPDTLLPRRVAVALPTTDSLVVPFIRAAGFSFIDQVPGVAIKRENPIPFLSIQEQLRQVAGVQVTPYSGAPGAGAAVRIRGVASINNNVQPLYVVDGVPVMQYRFTSRAPYESGTAEYINLNADASSNPLLSIAPEDIEQIEVLKGAFETGRYGFLGQNGVIRITTKHGAAAQPLRVYYTGYGGVQQARTRYKLLGASEIAAIANEANQNNGYAPEYTAAEIAAFGRGTDWQDEILRTAALQNHHLSVAGGTGFGTRYYAAATYANQKGIMLNSGLQRYGLRLTLDQQLGERLQLSGGINFSETQVRRPPTAASQQVIAKTLPYLPTIPVYTADGAYATDGDFINPVQRIRQSVSTPRNRRLLASAQLRYQPVAGLALLLRSSLERDSLLAKSYLTPQRPTTAAVGYLRQLQRAAYQQWVLNPAARYARTFAGRHAVEGAVEAAWYKWEQYQGFGTYDYLDRPDVYNPPASNVSLSTYTIQQRYRSYNAQAGYTYRGRYQVQASIQRGVISVLPKDDAAQWLPAAQATWHAGQEPWWPERAAVSALDAWAGWGKTSNRGNFTGSYNSMHGNSVGEFFFFNDELTTQLDAGLRLALWQDRLALQGALYQRKTHLQTDYIPLDESHIWADGVEITVVGTWRAGRLSGVSSLAGAINRSRYTKPTGAQQLEYSPSRIFVLRDDALLASFIGTQYTGLDDKGNPTVRRNMSGSGAEWGLLGSGLPRQAINFTQQLSYKKFELCTQLDGLFGYKIFDTNLPLLDVPINGFNATTRVRDRWTPTHTNTQVPRAGARTAILSGPNSYTLQSGNHLRVSALTLSATVWQRPPRSVSIFVTGTNLLVLTSYRGYDPNVSAAEADPLQAGLDTAYYPTARTVLLGLRATL